jgi:putative aldouronate transport system permease protein
MLFNGGLVPWYMVITNVLHIKDTLFALIMPYTIVAWYVILLKTFFLGLPSEIIEAAYVDGSSEFNTFIKIVLPMSKPALASVGFLMLLRYWNDWWLSLLFIETSSKQSLQYMLYALMASIEEIARDAQASGMDSDINFPSEAARMAMAVLAAGPMLFIFPFFQKYFVQGLTIGAVKG